jgi:hypothetical protein
MQCKAILFDSVILFFSIAKNIIYFTKLMSPNRQRSPSRAKKKLPYKADVLRQVTRLYQYII